MKDEQEKSPPRQPKPVSYVKCPNCDELTMKVIAGRIWECENCRFRENL